MIYQNRHGDMKAHRRGDLPTGQAGAETCLPDRQARRNSKTPAVSPCPRVPVSPRRFLITGFILLFGFNSVNAISDNAGTSNGAFLKIPTDARGVVMGAAMVSLAESSEGMRWNPAALALSDGQELSATHIQYYQDISIENVAFAYPLEHGTIGASMFYLSPGTLEGRDATGARTGDFSFYNAVGSVGFGRHVRSREESGMDIYLGGGIKIVREKIAEEEFTNPAVDLGMMVMPNDSLRTAFSLRNLSTGGKADFPKELSAGASYTFFRALTGAFALRYADDAPMRYSIGSEYKFPELENSILRLGYHSHDELDDSTDAKIEAFRKASLAGVTVGAGMELRPPNFKTLHFNIDYAIAPFGALGISHTVTLKLKW